MEPRILNDYRCDCGKLLFKGSLLSCELEIKCKRCGAVRIFRGDARGIRSFMLLVDGEGRVVDACDGVAAIEYSRQSVVGELLADILPLARDARYQEIISDPIKENYKIKNNTLFLRDRKAPLESHVVAVEGKKSLYRVFNIIREA